MLNETDRTPYYDQIKRDVLRKIESGELADGDKLESEAAMAKRYGVSSPTVRKAMDELVYAGVLWRRQGKGTFVSPVKLVKNLTRYTPFTELAREMGKKPQVRILEKRLTTASAGLAEALNIQLGDPVLEIISQNLINNSVMGLKIFHYPEKMFPGLLEQFVDDVSFFDLLDQYLWEHHNMRIHKCCKTFSVVQARREESERLLVKKDTSIILWEGVMYTDTGLPYERCKEYYRADKYSFYIEEYRALEGAEGVSGK